MYSRTATTLYYQYQGGKKKVRKWHRPLHYRHSWFSFVALPLPVLLHLPSHGWLLWSRLHFAAKFQLLGHKKN